MVAFRARLGAAVVLLVWPSSSLSTLMMSNIQGLHVLRGFLGIAERRAAAAAAVRLSRQAQLEAAKIERGVVSTGHNVNSQETFKSVSVTLEDGRKANCEHFDDYAEGHALTYYR